MYIRKSMKVYPLSICSLVLLGLGLFSCKDKSKTPQFHYEYFDLTPGRYIDYDVVEINHDVDFAIEHDTTYYQLRTVIGDTILDNEGRVARKFIRYKRLTNVDQWELIDVWTTIIDGNRAELVEENQRIVKLVFSPTLKKGWNPNAYNTYPSQNWYYDAIHDEKTIGAFTFDSTLVVKQADEQNLIEHKLQFEVYAKHVGLVRKYYKDLRINNFDSLNIQKGKELFYTCRGFGVQ